MTIRTHTWLLFLAIAASGLIGCGNSSTTSPIANPITPPKQGSVFRYHSYSFDSAGVKLPSSDVYDSNRVAAVGITYQGKTNVTQFVWGDGYTSYCNYEPNGDISRYIDGNGAIGFKNGWLVEPIATRVKQTLNEEDTASVAWARLESSSSAYVGASQLTFANHAFQAVTTEVTSAWSDGKSGIVETISWAPEIGTFVMTNTPWGGKPHNDNKTGFREELIGYTLQ